MVDVGLCVGDFHGEDIELKVRSKVKTLDTCMGSNANANIPWL